MMENLKNVDREIYDAICAEEVRQNNGLELIASENYVSKAVLEAVGSCLTNKYAEGYPGHRYYGGCENVDIVENLAIERLKQLYGCEHANVQPHSGASANMSVYLALLKPGDTILGMKLSDGGHLTHGSKVSISGKYFNAVSYGVNDQGLIDYDEVERIAKECQPKLIVAGASAYPRIIDFKRFREIADSVGAYLMVDMAHIAGLVATGLHPSPVPYADVVTSTSHKTLRGTRGGIILCREALAKQIDKAVFPGLQGGPLMHIIAGKAVCFKEALSPEFKEYQQQVLSNNKKLAETLKSRGVKLLSGGSDNHLLLLDLRDSGITGLQLETFLHDCNITVNKNSIPNDPQPASITSGIRIGTPAVTTKGLKEDDMVVIGNIIADVIEKKEDAIEDAKQKVAELCKKFVN